MLGGGCFWCVEAVFKQLDGVTDVRPGYAGGTAATADYKTVCSGRTEHAEVVEVVYDAGRIGLGEILKVFFAIAHDPTQVDLRRAPELRHGEEEALAREARRVGVREPRAETGALHQAQQLRAAADQRPGAARDVERAQDVLADALDPTLDQHAIADAAEIDKALREGHERRRG